MKITEALVTEHRVFCTVFDQIEEILPKLSRLAEVKLLTRLVEGLLLSHAAVEEDLVLVALDHLLERRGQSARFHRDHQEIDVRLKQAQTATQFVQARRLLQEAVLASRMHFGREERTIFPLVEKVMQKEVLTKLGRTWMLQRKPQTN